MRLLTASLFVLLISFQITYSRNSNDSINDQHEITLYFTNSTGRINWANPSDLFKSTNICYLKAGLRKNYYVIGHTQARLTSTLLPAPRYIAMTGAVQTEKVELVFKKKVGFGSLGSTIQGKLETEESIKKGIELYGKRNMLMYVKFKINAEAVRRILQFIEYYGSKNENGFAPYQNYNGALWPRYENEGSGCSAFGVSLLDVANIIPPEAKDWMVDINVPIDLIGGEFNNNKKIKFGSIYRTKSWYTGNGKEGVDYVNYKVYDPSIINDWIIKMRTKNDSVFRADEENGLKGLIVDRRNVVYDPNEPIVKQRTDTTLFVKHYHNLIQKKIKK